MYVFHPLLVALLGMIFFLPACGKLQAVVDVAEPKVSVGLGMTASDVARDSASRVIFHEVMPDGMRSEYHEDFAHELRYVHPVRGFSISGMESIAMIMENSAVNHIDDRPSSRMMSLDAGLAWCERTAAIIDKAGWTRDKDRTTFFIQARPSAVIRQCKQCGPHSSILPWKARSSA
ncbi:hypothetical protein [Massilia sp. CCM 8734]|uniref:hypothetical protein n=1 Tax=Massilia sp. CCM 8734 TaxID=2609283 RepID=UPI00141FBA1D|nr:hypothetical protein [Massilia sp. CCM 8734]NIA00505.1 hypothetical protein [Massilia sp. CCM 8734]